MPADDAQLGPYHHGDSSGNVKELRFMSQPVSTKRPLETVGFLGVLTPAGMMRQSSTSSFRLKCRKYPYARTPIKMMARTGNKTPIPVILS